MIQGKKSDIMVHTGKIRPNMQAIMCDRGEKKRKKRTKNREANTEGEGRGRKRGRGEKRRLIKKGRKGEEEMKGKNENEKGILQRGQKGEGKKRGRREARTKVK